MSTMPSQRTWGVGALTALFVGILCVLVALNRGHGTSVDEGHVFQTTRALVVRQSWHMEEPLNDRYYSRYTPLVSILAAPLFAAGWFLGGAAWAEVASYQLNALATAVAAVCLAVVVTRAGASREAGVFTAISYGLGSLATVYAGSLYTQQTAAALLVIALLCLVSGWRLATAIAWACLVWCREESLILLPALLGFGLCSDSRVRRAPGPLAAGSLSGLVLWGITNVLRGDPLLGGGYGGETFISDPLRGLYGLFLSAGKGLLFFSPLSALGLVAGFVYRPRWWVPLGAGAVAWSLMISAWWTWHGGYCWGPRLLLVALPLMHLGLAPLWDFWGPGRRVLLCTLAGCVLLQAVASGTHPYGERVGLRAGIATESEHLFVPAVAPLWIDGIPVGDWWWLRSGMTGPRWLLPCLGVALLVVGGTLLFLGPVRLLVRSVRRRDSLMPGSGTRMFGAVLVFAGLAYGPLANAIARRVEVGGASRRGIVYAPIGGLYEFHLPLGQPGRLEALLVDGQPVRATVRGAWANYMVDVNQGEHELVLSEGSILNLLWTSPGGVFYREPIPPLYRGTARGRPMLRLLRKLAEWRWIVCACGVYLLLVPVLVDRAMRHTQRNGAEEERNPTRSP